MSCFEIQSATFLHIKTHTVLSSLVLFGQDSAIPCWQAGADEPFPIHGLGQAVGHHPLNVVPEPEWQTTRDRELASVDCVGSRYRGLGLLVQSGGVCPCCKKGNVDMTINGTTGCGDLMRCTTPLLGQSHR